jgi:serine/threonine-protein kinase RsbW
MSSTLRRGRNQWKAGTRRLCIALESKMESTSRAAALVVQFAKKQNYGRHQCHEIELAVRETVANAVLHGNRCDSSKKVFLSAEMSPSGLMVCIRDEGKGFDPNAVPDPLVPGNLLQESGRGLFLVKAYMDEVIWRPACAGGMEITLTKYPSKTSRRETEE